MRRELSPAQVGTTKISCLEISLTKVRTLQIGTLKIGVYQGGVPPVRTSKIGSPEIDPWHVGGMEPVQPRVMPGDASQSNE
jgi:hypothetical protein